MREDNLKIQKNEGKISKRIYPIITNFFKNCKDGKILDIGCGNGNLSNRLLNMGFVIFGCDIFKNIDKKGINYNKVDLNIGILPYKNNYFDYVTCIEVIEHLENPRTIIKEISRVLKPKGMLILSTPNITSLPQKIYFLLTNNFLHFYFPSVLYGHITPINLGMLKDTFLKNKLEIHQITYDRGWIPLLRVNMPKNNLFGDLMIIKLKKI